MGEHFCSLGVLVSSFSRGCSSPKPTFSDVQCPPGPYRTENRIRSPRLVTSGAARCKRRKGSRHTRPVTSGKGLALLTGTRNAVQLRYFSVAPSGMLYCSCKEVHKRIMAELSEA